MSRFTEWYAVEQLKRMGWPKSKGLFRKESFVDTQVVDVVIEQSIQVSIGLGAGRPQLGVALMADTFASNPWSTESTAELLQGLKKGEDDVESSPDLPPWKALWAKHRIAPFSKDVPSHFLTSEDFRSVYYMASARGISWGLTHDGDMPDVFARAKADYERTAAEAIPYGLAVSDRAPWSSLENFYETCEDLVRAFESVRPPLPREVPSALRTAPEVAGRLRT